MDTFLNKTILIFFTALGIMIGAVMLGGTAAVIMREPPMATMFKLAKDMKIWAIAAAIGGTFSTFEVFESGLFHGEIRSLGKQILYIISALAGTQTGYYLLMAICGNNQK